jgi:hypothetical protein
MRDEPRVKWQALVAVFISGLKSKVASVARDARLSHAMQSLRAAQNNSSSFAVQRELTSILRLMLFGNFPAALHAALLRLR